MSGRLLFMLPIRYRVPRFPGVKEAPIYLLSDNPPLRTELNPSIWVLEIRLCLLAHPVTLQVEGYDLCYRRIECWCCVFTLKAGTSVLDADGGNGLYIRHSPSSTFLLSLSGSIYWLDLLLEMSRLYQAWLHSWLKVPFLSVNFPFFWYL